MSSMLDAALRYLANEWPVFPVCHPSSRDRCGEHDADKHSPEDIGKHPLVRWREYQDRLPTDLEVRRWWQQWPLANIGVATGALSGVCVIDLDGAGARADADRQGYLPGPWATTGRVGGVHVYFAWRDDAPTIFAKRNGIDFRGQGGFVLLPPSLHRSGARYTWREPPFGSGPSPPLPRWIDELAADHRGATGTAGVVLGDIPEHTRNQTLLSFGGTMRRRGMSQKAIEAALLVENGDRCRPPLDEAEVLKIAASVARYQPCADGHVLMPDTGTAILSPRAGRVVWPLERPRSIPIASAG